MFILRIGQSDFERRTRHDSQAIYLFNFYNFLGYANKCPKSIFNGEFFLLNNDLSLLRTPMKEETNGYLLTTDNYTRTLSSIIN